MAEIITNIVIKVIRDGEGMWNELKQEVDGK